MNKKATVLLIIWVCLIFISMSSVAFLSNHASNIYEDSTFYYRIMNAPTRSINNVTEDTVYIRKLEQSIKK